MGGGSSKSSSSSSTSTTQIDERLAATDNATILDVSNSSNISLLDGGAIEGAKEVSLNSINLLGQVTLEALKQGQQAVETVGAAGERVLSFVDEQNRDEGQRTLSEIMPYLVAGVSVLALTGAIKVGKF